MPKPERQSRTRRSTPVPPKVQKTLDRLQELYQVGRDSRERYPDRVPPGQMASEAERYQVHEETLRKARALVNTYTEDQLRKLRDRAQHRGFGLTFEHLIRLATVPDGRRRYQLALQTIRHGWSRQRLDDAIRSEFGKRYPGGRTPPPPADAGEARARLRRAAEQWRREYGVLTPVLHEKATTGTGGRRSSPAWQRRADEIDAAMVKLIAAIERQAERP